MSATIEAHRGNGRRFRAAGVESFALDEGNGEPVVCIHGVPASAFLYRKVKAELASRGQRGIAFDLPGLGLADRPEDFDYTWTGLGVQEQADAVGVSSSVSPPQQVPPSSGAVAENLAESSRTE